MALEKDFRSWYMELGDGGGPIDPNATAPKLYPDSSPVIPVSPLSTTLVRGPHYSPTEVPPEPLFNSILGTDGNTRHPD